MKAGLEIDIRVLVLQFSPSSPLVEQQQKKLPVCGYEEQLRAEFWRAVRVPKIVSMFENTENTQ